MIHTSYIQAQPRQHSHLKLIRAYPVFPSCLFGSRYYIYSTLQHTAGVLYVEYKYLCKYIRLPSVSNTRTARRWYRVCPISSTMQPRPKWECSQITYSTAAVQWVITTLENGQVHISIACIRITKIQRSSRNFHHWFKRCLRMAEYSWHLSLLGLELPFYELKNRHAEEAYPRRSPIRRPQTYVPTLEQSLTNDATLVGNQKGSTRPNQMGLDLSRGVIKAGWLRTGLWNNSEAYMQLGMSPDSAIKAEQSLRESFPLMHDSPRNKPVVSPAGDRLSNLWKKTKHHTFTAWSGLLIHPWRRNHTDSLPWTQRGNSISSSFL